MRPIWYEYTEVNTNLYFAAGQPGFKPPWFKSKSRWYRSLWYLYGAMMEVITYFITMANLIGSLMLTELFDVLASLPPLIHGIQISGRLISLKWRMPVIDEYVDELNDVLLEDLRNPIETEKEFREIHEGDFRLNRRLTIFEFICLLIANLIFFIPELVKTFTDPEEAHVIIVSWYPYDANITSNKQITNVFHTTTWLLINLKMASFDTFLQALIILHASQFRQMRYLLGKLIQEEPVSLVPMDREENVQLAGKLRWWIRQHQRILSATKKLEDICSPLLFFSYGECMFNMCLCAFLMTVESPWTPIQRVGAVCIVATIFVQMFVMCRLGDYLEESSVAVLELGYNPTMFRSMCDTQKSVVMVLKRVQSPVRFSAMKIFHLYSKDYGSLAQGVFSYYMALRQLQSRS